MAMRHYVLFCLTCLGGASASVQAQVHDTTDTIPEGTMPTSALPWHGSSLGKGVPSENPTTAGAKTQRPARLSNPSTPGRNTPRTTGNIEAGAIHGSIPYSVLGSTPWNAFLRGDISVDVLRIPVGIRFDLGTDLPLRGQRNTVRFSFDPPQALERERWADTEQLHEMRLRMDSLEHEHGTILRKLKGSEARMAALRSRYTGLHVTRPTPPEEAAYPALSLPSLDGDSIPHGTQDEIPSPALAAGKTHSARSDSLAREIEQQRMQLSAIEKMLAGQDQKLQRLSSLMNASRGPEGALTRFARGIKRLDIGSCSPTSSEFLINGVNFQGVSFEYAHKDLFLAVDNGRSFDDRWMDTDPVSRNLRLLQQSLFFVDTRDLNPRKLTAMRIGFGEVERTHVHVGYLRGTRENLPPGSDVPAGPGSLLRNHVAEIDAGFVVKNGHVLRLVYARSLVLAAPTDDDGQDRPSIGDLFDSRGNPDQAMKLGWSSTIDRTRTRVDLEARSISPWFQSFGMGFIRNGSRAIEARVDQAFGERWRMRARYALEERGLPGGRLQEGMSLLRGQAQFTYRPTNGLALRAGYMPVATRMAISDGHVENRNCSYTMGGTLRKRWKKLVAMLNVDLGRYAWKSSEGADQAVDNQTAILSLHHGDRWSLQCGWSGMSGASNGLVDAVSNITLGAGYRAGRVFNVDVASYHPNSGPTGWMCSVGKQVGQRMGLRLKGESYSRSDLYFSTEQWPEQWNDYTWSASAIYQW